MNYMERLINQLAKMKGMYLVLKHVPEHLHKSANRMGEAMSREVSSLSLTLSLRIMINRQKLPGLRLSPSTLEVEALVH